MITSNHQLDSQQLIDLESLVKQCQQHDTYVIPVYPHLLEQYRNLPSNVLYSHKQQLIGFLSVFFFYDDACEMVLMVHPDWRRNHIASQLIHAVIPVIQTMSITQIRMSSPHKCNDHWLGTKGFTYHNSEFEMQWQGGDPSRILPPGISIRLATEADVDFLVGLDELCFHTQPAVMKARLNQLLSDEQYTLFVIENQGQLIGKAHLHARHHHVLLSDIAIVPEQRNHGYGRCLIEHIIIDANQRYAVPIRLEVESNNENALKLYLNMGFTITNACDFWDISIDQLVRIIQ